MSAGSAVHTASDATAPTTPSPPRISHLRTTGRARAIGASIVLAAITAVVFCVSISVGDFPIPLREVIETLLGGGSDSSQFIIETLRLPRALTAVLVGAAFGLSGAVFQSMARNPLASPDIIGITAGSSAAAVFVVVIIGGTHATVSLGALCGSLVTALLIYLLAWKQGVSPYRIVLVGIGLGAMLSAVTAYLLTRAEIWDAARATVWITGSLNGRTWDTLRPLTIAMAVLVPAIIGLTRSLRALQLGDDTAAGIGVPVNRARGLLVLVAVTLAAVATAAAGPIAFVAFVSAPIARRIVRAPLAVVPAALVGALLLLSADLIARRVFAPTELPVGVVTGVLGAPYLLWLLARSNRIGAGG